MNVKEVSFWYWLVRRLPKKLVYFCFMHVLAYNTSGKYGTTVISELTAMDAIDRYGKYNGI